MNLVHLITMLMIKGKQIIICIAIVVTSLHEETVLKITQNCLDIWDKD